VNADREITRAEERVLERLRTLCPPFTADGPARHTETSLLIPGRVGQTRVLAKHPVDPRPFWQARARHEITVYAAVAAAGPPPVPLPRMTGADRELPVILITLLPGSPLDPDRYPASPVPPDRLDRLLDAVQALNSWNHPALAAIPPDTDYSAQFQALPADLFNAGELGRLAGHATRLARRLDTRIEHGDPHPGNALAAPGSAVALIDLESLARRLPGYDLAVLWTVTGPHHQLRERITSRVGPSPCEHAAFWLNAVLVTSREILSHRRGASTAAHRDRLVRLQRDLRHARAQAAGHYAPGMRRRSRAGRSRHPTASRRGEPDMPAYATSRPGGTAPVVFDCDGLLVSTQDAWDRAYARIASRYGTALTSADRHALVGLQLEQLGHALAALLGHPAPPRQLGQEVYAMVCDGAGCDIDLMPGAAALVRAIHGTRPIAVASNTPHQIVASYLERTEIIDAFDAIVCSDHVANPKPAPDVYLAACERLACNPGACTALEDSPTGAAAALTAGMYLIAVPSAPDLVFPAHQHAASLNDPGLWQTLGLAPQDEPHAGGRLAGKA